MPEHGDILAHAFIPGSPKTKGSLNMIPGRKCTCCGRCKANLPGGHVEENVVGSKVWRQRMAESLRGAQGDVEPWAGAVTIAAAFYLPTTDVTRVRSGDLDKLLRNGLDAAQDAATYVDDVQVVRILSDKFEATATSPKGLSIALFAGRV